MGDVKEHIFEVWSRYIIEQVNNLLQECSKSGMHGERDVGNE